METYKVRLRVAGDGILKIELPVGIADKDVEVLIVVQPLEAQSPPTDIVHEPAMHRAKRKHPRAYASWGGDEESQLMQLFHAGKSVSTIATKLQRQPGAIRSRIRKIRESHGRR